MDRKSQHIWSWMYFAVRVMAVLALVSSWAYALDPARQITQYIQSSWTNESGLPQNSVHAIAQTSDGYLWFGTEEGLARFDGLHFRVYTHEKITGLPSNYIRILAAGPGDTLWIGTDSGLSVYRPAQTVLGGVFHSFTTRNGLASNSITALCRNPAGGIWVGTSRGLALAVHGRIEDWSGKGGPGHNEVQALAVDRTGTLWVATNQGLFYRKRGRFVHLTVRNGLPGNSITALTAAPDGSLWVGTLSHGIARIRQGQIYVPPIQGPWHEVVALRVDRNGALWMAFDRHGIARFYDGKLEFYNAGKGLPSNRCTRALFQDREGSLWIGTLDAGVVQLRDGAFAVFGKPEGLSGDYIGNILQARDGSMWIGADSNGLDHLLPNGKVQVWNQRQGLPRQAVFSLLQTRNQDLWVGYRLGELARIHRGRVTIYRDPQAHNLSLNALFQDRQGRIWVGSYGKGLALFDHGMFHHVTHSGSINAITQSPDGAIWAGTDGNGVERIVGTTITRFTVEDGLPSNHVMCVYADRDGNIWVGTSSGGLSRIRNGHIVSWTRTQGLPASAVGSILEDNSGHLWMGSDTGIFRVSMKELNRTAAQPGERLHPRVFGLAEGLRSRETLYGSMPSAWKDRDGRLWFATIKGAAVINPADLHADKLVPPVRITAMRYDARPVPVKSGMELGPGAGNLEIHFAALSFVAPRKTHFCYRLVGFEDHWIHTRSRHTVWYTNLPPGSYTFQVEAANSDGVWNRKGASLSFVLKPSPFETPWAYAGYGMLGILLAWGMISLRTRHLTRREKELKQLVAERTAQLETEKAALVVAQKELSIQATHDSLSGLLNRAAILKQLELEIIRATREKKTLGVLLLDLDHFKQVNDQYGHLCGDEIIRVAAERLQGVMRAYDMIGRYGGEEFLAVFPDFHPELHPERVEELLDAIRRYPFETREKDIRLTCSIGVGTFRPESDLPEMREVISRADTALYVAKDLGRNCFAFEARSSIDHQSRD